MRNNLVIRPMQGTEKFQDSLMQLQKHVIGYFRIHLHTEVLLVLSHDPLHNRIVVANLNDQLSMLSQNMSVTHGVLTLFDVGENLYTLRTTNRQKLQGYYESTLKLNAATRKGSSYMAILT